MLTLYAKKLDGGSVTLQDENGIIKCEFQKYHSSKPTKRNKYITYNCYRYKLVWLS